MTQPTFYYENAPEKGEEHVDGAEAWELAKKHSRRKIADFDNRVLRVRFDHGPVCIMHNADWHIPAIGTDYDQLDADLALLSRPGFFGSFVGDLVNNYIIGKLKALQMFEKFTVNDQWAMLKYALGRIPAGKALWFVNGNHDLWTQTVAGIDYFADVADRLVPPMAYDPYDLLAHVRLGNALFRFRVRHKWRGYSQFNATHGIEQTLRLDGNQFDIGVGAHTHVAAVVREFHHEGETKLAVQCGSYKVVDDYAQRLGVPEPNRRAAAFTILEEDGTMWGTSSRTAAVNYMAAVYGDGTDGTGTDRNLAKHEE